MCCVNDNISSAAYRKAGALTVPPFFFGVALLNGHTTLRKAPWESIKSDPAAYTQVLQCSFAALKTRFHLLPKVTQGSLLALPVLALPFSAWFFPGTHLRLLSAVVFWPWRKCDVPLGTHLLICPFPCPPEVACRFWCKTILAFQCRKFRPVFTTFLSLIASPHPFTYGPPCVHKTCVLYGVVKFNKLLYRLFT